MAKHTLAIRSEISVPFGLSALSLESITVPETTTIFRELLPALSKQLKNTASSLELPFKNLFSSQETRVIKKAKEINYLYIADSIIDVPEGFSGELLAYIRVLLDLESKAYGQTTSFLQDYHVILSSFLTNKDDQVSSKDQKSRYDHIEKTTNEYKSKLMVFFENKNTLGRVRFSSVIKRMSDVPEIIEGAMKLESQHKKNELKSLEVDLNKITAMLDLIISRMQSEDINKISPAAARNLAFGAEQLAKNIEFIAFLHFKAQTVVTTTDYLIKMLDKHY